MIAHWTDITLLFHTVLGLTLAWMIWKAAQRKYQRGIWRSWPPALLILWAASEGMDALIYGRRLLARLGVDEVGYETWVSLGMNLLSLVAITMLIYRIQRGDIDDDNAK